MPLQIVDYSEVPHVLGQVAAVVTPRCRAPPPAPHLGSVSHLAQALRRVYGVQIMPALQDQRDLGLDVVDPVLLFGQLPLESAWTARLMPHGNGIYKCVASWPDPITAAVAVLSHKPGPVAVDLRYGGVKYVNIVVSYAEEVGVELQLIVTKPLDVGGEVVFHASTPPYVREKYIKAPGDVSVKRGGVALGEAPLDSRPADGEEPPFHKALERVAEVLGLSLDVLGDLVTQGVVSHSYLMDFVSAWQLGYLAKWDLVRQVPGGWSATPKLIFLYGLYRR
jgi:hypothetical protein